MIELVKLDIHKTQREGKPIDSNRTALSNTIQLNQLRDKYGYNRRLLLLLTVIKRMNDIDLK